MAKFSWSEVFMSIEGEGPWSGWPTVYIRFTGCNFTCSKFNNPDNLDTTSIEGLGFDPLDYDNIYDIPLISKGCDSIYSWDDNFRHMWTEGDEATLAQTVIDVLPHKQLINPNSGRPTILSLTGGEPTLRAKHLMKLLNHCIFVDLQMILIETNCSVPLSEDFIEQLYKWSSQAPGRKVIWSNSPKLSISGEPWEKAIRPEIAYAQVKYQYVRDAHIEQYFKFVCGPNESDFDEVEKAMQEYYHAGISYGVGVYIMPTACLEEQQQQIAAQVAKLCIERGYIYCHRIQNSVFGNGVGT